jgi:translation initiation factor 2 gamma subunit (eIF-2gamma)
MGACNVGLHHTAADLAGYQYGRKGFKGKLMVIKDLRCCREIQFTLVDCPGHASLIRTIIGGAQIIDLMLLVVDVTKGIQVPN